MKHTRTLARAGARLLHYTTSQLVLFMAGIGLIYVFILFLLSSTLSSHLIDRLFNEHFQGSIHWDRVYLGPLPWQIYILGLEIREPDGTRVISADTLEVDRFDLAQVLQGNIHLDGIRLGRTEVFLRELGLNESVINIAKVFESKVPSNASSSDTRLEIEIRDVQIRDLKFVMEHSGVSIDARGLTLFNGGFGLLLAPDGSRMTIDGPSINGQAVTVQIADADEQSQPLGWQLEEIHLRGFDWQNDQFTVAKFKASVDGDQLSVANFFMDLTSAFGPIIGMKARLDAADLAKHVRQFGLKETRGAAVVELEGRGAVSNFTGSLDFHSKSLLAEGYALDNVTVSLFLIESQNLQISPSELKVWSGKIGFAGELNLLSGVGQFGLKIDGIDPMRIPGLEQPVQFNMSEGRVAGNLSVNTKRLFNHDRHIYVESKLGFRRSNLKLSLAKTLRLDLKAQYQEGRIELDRFDLKSEDDAERLSISGWIDHVRAQLSLTGTASLDEISPIAEMWALPLSGSLVTRFALKDTFTNPTVDVVFLRNKLSYEGISDVEVSGRVSYENRAVIVEKLKLANEKTKVSIAGRMKPNAPTAPLQFSLKTENVELKYLHLPNDVQGRASLEVDLTGSIEKPTAQVRGRIRDLCVLLEGLRAPFCIDGIQTSSTLSKDKFTIDRFVLRDEKWGMIKAYGKGSLKAESFSGSLDLVDFPLEKIDKLLATPMGLKGTVDADLSLAGSLAHPLGGGRIVVQDLSVGQYELDDVMVLIMANDVHSMIQFIMLDGQRLVVWIPFSPDSPPRAELRLKNFVPKTWIPQLRDVPLDAEITGKAWVNFKDLSFALDTGAFDLVSSRINYQVGQILLGLQHEKPIELRLTGKDLEINAADLELVTTNLAEGDQVQPETALRFTLSGQLPQLTNLDVNFEGDVYLRGLRPFIKGTFTKSEGVGRISGRIVGPLEQPKPTIDLSISRLQLTPRSAVIGSVIELRDPLNLELRAMQDARQNGDWILQSRHPKQSMVRLLRDESVFNLKALTVELRQFQPRRIVVNAGVLDLALRIPGILKATINAPMLEVEWSKAQRGKLLSTPELRISGDIEVQRGEYVKDITSVSEINEGVRNRLIGRSVRKQISAAERFPILKRLKLDLSVMGDGDFFVRNRVTVLSLDMEIKIALERITGYLYPASGDDPQEQLNIVGDVTILPDSKLIYARRDFEVNRGIIDFGRGQFMDAELEASRTFTLRSNRSSGVTNTQFDRGGGDVRLEEVSLTARIQQGSLQGEPRISMNLSSNSGASKFDVAMLVLTGSYPEDASSAASAQPATEVLLAPLLSLVERPLEDTLDIDLSLTPATAGSLFIDIDKMLSRRLRLYSRVFVGDSDDTNPQQFGVEYQINNTVVGEFTSEKTGNYLSTAGRLRLRLELD